MKTLLLFLLVSICSSSYCQNYEKASAMGSNAQAICHNPKNGIVAAGFNFGNILAYRVDTTGNVLWSKTFDYSFNNLTNSSPTVFEVLPTSDSCFLIAGKMKDFTAQPSPLDNFFVLKLNAQGDLLWEHVYSGGPSVDCGHAAMVETADSNYALIWGDAENGSGFSLIYMSPSGAGLSEHAFEWSNPIDVMDAEVLSDSTFMILGNMNPSNVGSTAFISEINLSGAINWTKVYPDFFFLDGAVLDSIIYISGIEATGDLRYFMGACNLNGNMQWMKTAHPNGSQIWNVQSSCVALTDTTVAMYYGREGAPSNASILNTNDTTFTHHDLYMVVNDLMPTVNGGALFLGNGPILQIKCLYIPEIGMIQKDSIFTTTDCFGSYASTTDFISWSQTTETFTIGTVATEFPTNLIEITSNLFFEDRCVYTLSGLDELSENNFVNVYPNISEGIFHFESSLNESIEILVYSSDGRLIETNENIYGTTTLDLSRYSNGSYYYKARSESGYVNNGTLILNR